MYCIRCSEKVGEEKRCLGCQDVFDITKLCDVSVAMRNYNGLCGSNNPKTVYNEDKESLDFDGIRIKDVEAGRSQGENQVEYFKGSVAIIDSKDGAHTHTVVRSEKLKGHILESTTVTRKNQQFCIQQRKMQLLQLWPTLLLF